MKNNILLRVPFSTLVKHFTKVPYLYIRFFTLITNLRSDYKGRAVVFLLVNT